MKTLMAAVCLAMAAPVAAAQSTFGDWIVHEGEGGIVAATENDSGQTLGKLCLPEQNTCLWTLITDTACTVGDTIPVLANAESGSYHLKLECRSDKTGNFQFFHDPDTLDGISNADNAVGIALPMVGGTFRVMRFSLRGSDKAIGEAMQRAINRRDSSTRDVTL